MAKKRTCFHAVWTARNRETRETLVDQAFASGPVSTRELAERIARDRHRNQHKDAVVENFFWVAECEMEPGAEYWDELYERKLGPIK